MNERIRSSSDLDRAAQAGQAMLRPPQLKILIGSASCGIAVGAQAVEAEARRAVQDLKLDAMISRTGCMGYCSQEPLLDLLPPNGSRISYGKMTAEKTRALLNAYASSGDLKPEWALGSMAKEELVSTGSKFQYSNTATGTNGIPEWSDLPFYRRQKKVILRNCGSIDPLNLEEAIARGTYRGAFQAITAMSPDAVIEQIMQSGLRGRGGAAFPTGQKWKLARQAAGNVKYAICNADEGEPGAYMDRTVLESDPHAILEGMLIGAFAIGAAEGFLYIRSEYPLAIEILEHAIRQAEAAGLLGENILDSGFSFTLHVRRGAGAYVCGEETALLESLEGRAGEPRTRPPFPVTQGLWGNPTVVNNVKTWASIAPIITRGAEWYAGMGTKRLPGTTIFSLEGAVKNAGLVEVPFGIPLRDLVYEIGGGVSGNKPLKALQAGGASRGCIPPELMDLAIDTEDRAGATIMIGTGGIIVLDESSCMVDMARFLTGFFLEESCGKCVPCREGTRQMYALLTRMSEGKGTAADLGQLEYLARTARASAVCGLGGMAPNAVLTTLNHFRPEFEAHLQRKPCSVCG